jgi:hypothetical protein
MSTILDDSRSDNKKQSSGLATAASVEATWTSTGESPQLQGDPDWPYDDTVEREIIRKVQSCSQSESALADM